MTLAFAISSALFYREKTGNGQYIDVSMIGSAMNLLESNLIDYSLTQKNPKRTRNQDNLIAPFGMYKVKDGNIVIAIGNNILWEKFAVYLNKFTSSFNQTLFATNNLRLANQMALTEIIESSLKDFSPSEAIEILSQLGIPCGQVAEMSDIYANSFLYKSNFLEKKTHPIAGSYVTPKQSIIFSEMKELTLHDAPQVGQDNETYDVPNP
jgi:CoA:oxalate CoA-transferase